MTFMSNRSFTGREPPLRVEEYFAGHTRAVGIFQDRSGNLRRQFQLEAQGSFDGEALTLNETFTYDDGETQQRVWTIRPTGDHSYVATTEGLFGTANGRADRNTFHMDYDIALEFGARRLTVHFSDWMFLQPDGTLLNRADVTKFGILIGQVTCAFRRVEIPA